MAHRLLRWPSVNPTSNVTIQLPAGMSSVSKAVQFQTVQRHGVYSAAYGTVHYKEPLKSFEIRVGHSPGFGLPSVAILPWLCRKWRKAIFIYNTAEYHQIIECAMWSKHSWKHSWYKSWWEICKYNHYVIKYTPSRYELRLNVGSMLAQRRRRWTNINSTLILMFLGHLNTYIVL